VVIDAPIRRSPRNRGDLRPRSTPGPGRTEMPGGTARRRVSLPAKICSYRPLFSALRSEPRSLVRHPGGVPNSLHTANSETGSRSSATAAIHSRSLPHRHLRPRRMNSCFSSKACAAHQSSAEATDALDGHVASSSLQNRGGAAGPPPQPKGRASIVFRPAVRGRPDFARGARPPGGWETAARSRPERSGRTTIGSPAAARTRPS